MVLRCSSMRDALIIGRLKDIIMKGPLNEIKELIELLTEFTKLERYFLK
jgi:hypothetical protein